MGLESDGEYLDVELNTPENMEEVKYKLNEQMAEGMEVLSAVVQNIPGKDLVFFPTPCIIKINGNAAVPESFHPQLILVIFAPGIEHTTLFVGFQNNLGTYRGGYPAGGAACF